MKNFVKLTVIDPNTDKPAHIYIQSMLVESLTPIDTDASDGVKTGVYLMSGNGYAVTETIEQVLKLITDTSIFVNK